MKCRTLHTQYYNLSYLEVNNIKMVDYACSLSGGENTFPYVVLCTFIVGLNFRACCHLVNRKFPSGSLEV